MTAMTQFFALLLLFVCYDSVTEVRFTLLVPDTPGGEKGDHLLVDG
jgi:hypothetical protein